MTISPPLPAAKKETRPEPTPDGRAAFDFTETERAGFYDVVLNRTPRVSMTYAVNPDSETESNLNTILPEDLKRTYPDFEFSYIAKSDDFGTRMLNERHGTELWPWLIGMIFVLLAAESILANRWAPRD